jgi:uncharacterized protein (DUF433 family)
MSVATIDLNGLLEAREGFRQGRPVLRGTGITVQTIVAAHLRGETPEEILEGFPHASLAAIHAALAYYYAHKDEMDAEYEEDVRWGEERIAEQEREWKSRPGRT